MGLFWELHQYRRIGEASSDAARASSRAGEAASEVKLLEGRIDKLALVCNAMWTLLQEKTELTEEDLLTRVQAIDLQDGQLDGKVAKVSRCPKCDRVMSRRHTRCLYCGAPDLSATAFDSIL